MSAFISASGIADVIHEPLALAKLALPCIEKKLPESAKTWSGNARELVLQDLSYHISFIATAGMYQSPELLNDYIDWLKVLSSTLGFSPSSILQSFSCLAETSKIFLPERISDLLADWFAKAGARYSANSENSSSYMKIAIENNKNASLFLTALLEGKRPFAMSIIETQIKNGATLIDIYENIILPSQYEVGRLWLSGKISVAQEHYVTAATQYMISLLYPEFFMTARPVKPLVIAACPQTELHELGIRMIADTFQYYGWDTVFLGASVPTADLLKEIERLKPAVVNLSATIATHIPWIQEIIRQVRNRHGDSIKILVGGRAFFTAPDLWESVGADGTAVHCTEAVALAENLLAS